MTTPVQFHRPPYEEALDAWKTLLRDRRLPTDLLWIFDENLCFERDPDSMGGFRLGFQTAFTPPPPQAEQTAYDSFTEFEFPIVFYAIGAARGKTICLLLCDEWFENKGQADGFVCRNDWRISLHPGTGEPIEEISDERRWKNRIVRERPLHALDFCLPLRAVHEIMAHGRVLTVYERYALKFLHAWRRLLGH